MLVQVDPSMDTWIWKALAYATSQISTTWSTAAVAPRSTCSHCGSLNWLDQRVSVLPSTAAEAGVPAFSTDEAMTGFPLRKQSTCRAGLPHRDGGIAHRQRDQDRNRYEDRPTATGHEIDGTRHRWHDSS